MQALELDSKLDLAAINSELRDASPEDIIHWALAQNMRTLSTTSFGKNAAVLLDMLTRIDDSVPVVWVDTGYNLRDTYVVAEKLMQMLNLNMHIYTPTMSSERRNAIMGGIPTIEDGELHEEFTRQVKLEPFSRAIAELKPELWLTGIRSSETEHRKSLDIVSWDARGILKVAPLYHWSEDQIEAYRLERELPSCRHYFDPTKVSDGRECGLHTSA